MLKTEHDKLGLCLRSET